MTLWLMNAKPRLLVEQHRNAEEMEGAYFVTLSGINDQVTKKQVKD